MGFAVYMPKTIEFQDRTTGSGPRVYARSLCMLLYSALQDVLPDTRLRIEHSISHGYYCRLAGYADVPQTLIDDVFARMRELSAADVPFCRHEEPTEEVKKMFDRRGQHSKSELLRTTRELYTVYYSLGDVCDSYYGALAPSTGYIDVFDIIKYKEGFLLMPFDAADPSRPAQYIAQEKMYKAFTDYLDFNHIVGVRNAGEAVLAAQLAREAFGTEFIKLEIHPDPKYLLPDPVETLRATEELARMGFVVLPYIQADPVLCKRLEEAGAATVMPLAAPIGTNKGLVTRHLLEIIIEQSRVPVVVDAGLGAPSHAAEAMELGADAVLVNTAIAVAGNPAAMAKAFAKAVEAGRMAYEAGLGAVSRHAEASSPLTSFLDM